MSAPSSPPGETCTRSSVSLSKGRLSSRRAKEVYLVLPAPSRATDISAASAYRYTYTRLCCRGRLISAAAFTCIRELYINCARRELCVYLTTSISSRTRRDAAGILCVSGERTTTSPWYIFRGGNLDNSCKSENSNFKPGNEP